MSVYSKSSVSRADTSHTSSSQLSRSQTSQRNRSLSPSLDIEIDYNNHRKYPSIKDYYQANSNALDKPIQLQKGLSNYSSLQLGDDRISVNESVLSEAYRVPAEPKLLINSPSRNKAVHARMRDYEDAKKKVSDEEINRLESVMKDKLIQRSYATSSPFQVRKAFKFFDRERSMRISIEGFTKALEFLGFQFSEIQNLALFAKYDPEYTGYIDYMEFIVVAMFYDAAEPLFGNVQNHLPVKSKLHLNEVSDIDSEELKILQKAEIKKVFHKIDKHDRGEINKEDLELLLMALGYHVNKKELEYCQRDLGLAIRDYVTFDNFFEWWTSEIGANYLKRKL
eukprot:gene17445-22997_t